MSESVLNKNTIISELLRSPHGNLADYLPVGIKAVRTDPEFFAHLIAWNAIHGQIRDASVALPVIGLSPAPYTTRFPEFEENAYAHLMALDPRNLVRAYKFAKEHVFRDKPDLKDMSPSMMFFRRLITGYLKHRERDFGLFERAVVAHRKSMKTLYSLTHTKPSTMAERILFHRDRPAGSLIDIVYQLPNMTERMAAGAIIQNKIPFLTALGSMGARAKDPDLLLALIERMSPTELVTNTKFLTRLGVNDNPSLRAAFEKGLERAATSKKTTFKATAMASKQNAEMAPKLQRLQEKQLDALSVEGNWLILADKSGSMTQAIETARQIAGTLTRLVRGNVHLVFFDTSPRYVAATGKSYEDLLQETRSILAAGGTSIGCGLQYALRYNLPFEGIVIVSDLEENQLPYFSTVYQQYTNATGTQPPIYVYGLNNAVDRLKTWNTQDLDVQIFDCNKIDYYSLPNLVATMRTNPYSLADEIMETRLLRLPTVLPHLDGHPLVTRRFA